MTHDSPKSEIRDSTIRTLLDKVRRQNYDRFLLSIRLQKMRMFSGASITFDFPVVALIGPNGGGKTTILGTCGCIYSNSIQNKVFQKSSLGDEGMNDWSFEYELIDKAKNARGTVRGNMKYSEGEWKNSEKLTRDISYLSLMRTLPLSENPNFHIRSRLTKLKKTKDRTIKISTTELPETTSHRIREEGARVLGKSLSGYKFYEITATVTRKKAILAPERVRLPDGRLAQVLGGPRSTTTREHTLKQTMYIGKNEIASFSELNFGAGESSVLRIIADIESMAEASIVLIDEIENGLHPVAVRRLVEYLMDVAQRKRVQAIFTTHSDYALDPLPSEAIWACLDGTVQQGKLSVAALRAVSGRIDKRLAIFVEDDFVNHWLTAILRERLGENIDEIGIYPVGGDGNAVKTHISHLSNPAIQFKSLCFLDGDSKQMDSPAEQIFRMPGGVPETAVFDQVLSNIDKNIALLTVACQRPLERQSDVQKAILSISQTNRDPHLLFVQIGERLGFLPETIVRGAFFAVWIQENPTLVDQIVAPVLASVA